MQAIADKAQVNQNLIYHHFKNKAALWKITKAYIFSQVAVGDDALPLASHGLKAVLSHLIHQRFMFYNNRKAARMMLWQQLEPNQEGLMSSGAAVSPDQWRPVFAELQEQGMLRKDIDPDFIISWVSSSVTGVLFANQPFFKGNTQRKQAYIDRLIREFNGVLSA